jgi:hypothetical protein
VFVGIECGDAYVGDLMKWGSSSGYQECSEVFRNGDDEIRMVSEEEVT